ncbi:ATPase, T2SS/T4P/T4SS family [Ammoniphilus resinae]|uniref:Pilus assembly protein CpaF n=1 Tax=Ammoniphilus resinae TaxID=861532 RepID=A0ABS4GNH2_9BACL|nr:ATPase, T2SS/T4P/T4SS family [Ammoniphilus resinae]MBP1931813.1 pilus assembly protein CpaF [Ammoniphilus resinae]
MAVVQYDQLDLLRRKNTLSISLEEKQLINNQQQVVNEVIRDLNTNETELINAVYQGKVPRSVLEEKIDERLAMGIVHSDIPKKQIKKLTMDELFGYGFLHPYIEDPTVTDIFVNSHKDILIRQKGKDIPLNLSFESVGHLEEYFRKILSRLGARADKLDPIVDTRDQERHLRLNGAVPPVVKVPYFTIRKHQADSFNHINALISGGTLTQEMADDLGKYVGSWMNILVSGPTGSGKTTFMRCLATTFIDDLERLAVLEEEEELSIDHNNIVAMETKKKKGEDDKPIEMDLLVKNGMRMSARRIILGELRHKEALELVRAFGTGHDGGMTSIHANGVKEALKQLAFLMLYADTPLKYEHLLSMIADTVDIVVHVVRHKVVEIAEVTGYDAEKQVVMVKPIWYYDVDPKTDEGFYRKDEESPELLKKMALRRALRK